MSLFEKVSNPSLSRAEKEHFFTNMSNPK